MGVKLVSTILAVALAAGAVLAPAAWAQERMVGREAAPREKGDGAYAVGAAFATAVNIPAKTALCTLGLVSGFVVLVGTLGSGHRAAGRVWEEGCGGPWVITADHIKGDGGPDLWIESDYPK